MNIAELRKLMERATKYDHSPWIDVYGSVLFCSNINREISADQAGLIVAAINALPALLAVAEAAKTVAASYDVMNDDLDALSDALAKLEKA